MIRKIKIALLLLLFGVVGFFLSGCVTFQNQPVNNACQLFTLNPSWWQIANNTAKKWQLPVAVQLAIINQESSFDSTARPVKRSLFGIIPVSYRTSAYGYSQAIDSAWSLYQQDTGHYFASRNNFADADDFLGWYYYHVNKDLKIKGGNAQALYLAYHEGIAGYHDKTYCHKSELLIAARRVQAQAQIYQAQLNSCKKLQCSFL